MYNKIEHTTDTGYPDDHPTMQGHNTNSTNPQETELLKKINNTLFIYFLYKGRWEWGKKKQDSISFISYGRAPNCDGSPLKYFPQLYKHN